MYIRIRNAKLFLYARKLLSENGKPYLIQKDIRKARFIRRVFVSIKIIRIDKLPFRTYFGRKEKISPGTESFEKNPRTNNTIYDRIIIISKMFLVKQIH